MLDEAQIITLRLLGHTYWRMGYPDKAERLFKALLSLLPGDVQCLCQLAAIALQKGRVDEALERLDAADGGRLSPAGGPAIALMRAQVLWRLGRPTEAQAAFDTYLRGRAAAGEGDL